MKGMSLIASGRKIVGKRGQKISCLVVGAQASTGSVGSENGQEEGGDASAPMTEERSFRFFSEGFALVMLHFGCVLYPKWGFLNGVVQT
jgi:hypothetical protein